MIELSTGLQIAWKIAALEANDKRSESIEAIHFILGLLSFDKIPEQKTDDQYLKSFFLEKKIFYEILNAHNIDIIQTRRIIRSLLPLGNANYSDNIIHRSEDCKNLFIQAKNISGNSVTSLSYFAAALNEQDSLIEQIFRKNNINLNSLKRQLSVSPDTTFTSKESETIEPSTKYKYLSEFGKDMVSLAEKSMFSVFEGREDEIKQIITTIGKKTKHNPIIIGEPGVGKTAIVEGLAQLIFKGKVLPERRIFQISAASLVSGTKFRGEFEERLINIIEEASKYPEVIIFFDEIHQFLGAGAGEGGLDAANILKPALSRGSLTCIGATTINEYRKYIEKDPAFTRRFQTININEPSIAESIKILNRIKPELEKHHHVIIHDDAIQASVEYSVRYECERCLPDKAIDLLDESCSAVSNRTITISDIDDLSAGTSVYPIVDSTYVAKLISRRKGIPVSQITQHEAEKFSKLETILKEKIKGQDNVILEVANYIKISKAGMGDASRPIAVFLFIGPTGVGKTYLAKTLAATLFSSESDLVRYDMSEYMESHSVSKLIGSPPGYILSEEEGALIKNLRNKPYSVVLFDEIDKAHPRILDLLLQLFDEGRITDNKGRLIDGRNAIFILTSNFVGLSRKFVGFNFHEEEIVSNQVLDNLKKSYRPEFLNRINKILVFNSLVEKDIKIIIDENIKKLFSFLKEKFNITVVTEGDLTNYIMSKCSFDKYGAREVNREIERVLKEPVSQYIIDYQAEGRSILGCCLNVTVFEKNIEFKIG